MVKATEMYSRECRVASVNNLRAGGYIDGLNRVMRFWKREYIRIMVLSTRRTRSMIRMTEKAPPQRAINLSGVQRVALPRSGT
jgi:hypothetical protein